MDKQSKLEKAVKDAGLTESEAILALKGIKSYHPSQVKTITTGHKSFSYTYFTDAHIGHSKFVEALFYKMINDIKKRKPEFVIDSGDHFEGMSGRPGHVYELAQMGYSAQMRKVEELYKQIPVPIFGIDGNHDEWYSKKNNGGVIVGEEMQKIIPNYKHLGVMEGNIFVDGIKIMLFHPNDGTAYAHSYKLQKLIESFTGGEKPNIVHSGHYHKQLAMFTRNVFGFEGGTLCGQSEFMKGKKIAAHMGYGHITVYHNGQGTIDRLVHEFVPYFEEPQKPYKFRGK